MWIQLPPTTSLQGGEGREGKGRRGGEEGEERGGKRRGGGEGREGEEGRGGKEEEAVRVAAACAACSPQLEGGMRM